MSSNLRLRGGGGGGGRGGNGGRGGGGGGGPEGPIPFPGRSAWGRGDAAGGSARGSARGGERAGETDRLVREVERTLDKVQGQVDELLELVEGPIRFPGALGNAGRRGDDDDDRPTAA